MINCYIIVPLMLWVKNHSFANLSWSNFKLWWCVVKTNRLGGSDHPCSYRAWRRVRTRLVRWGNILVVFETAIHVIFHSYAYTTVSHLSSWRWQDENNEVWILQTHISVSIWIVGVTRLEVYPVVLLLYCSNWRHGVRQLGQQIFPSLGTLSGGRFPRTCDGM